MPVVSLVVMLGQIKCKSISLGMAPMLGLSCTFLACVFDRPGWKLYSKPCHGPLVGLCWVTWWLCWAYVRPMLSKKMPPFGLMFSQFQPRPKKNQVWVAENRPFWAMPQPYWAYPVPSWGYVGPILQQLAHPLLGLHVAILHCIKLNLT